MATDQPLAATGAEFSLDVLDSFQAIAAHRYARNFQQREAAKTTIRGKKDGKEAFRSEPEQRSHRMPRVILNFRRPDRRILAGRV
jgi:hypothetical protein